jgi:hypothetical protein
MVEPSRRTPLTLLRGAILTAADKDQRAWDFAVPAIDAELAGPV